MNYITSTDYQIVNHFIIFKQNVEVHSSLL